jgi:hypothetical protein
MYGQFSQAMVCLTDEFACDFQQLSGVNGFDSSSAS